MTELATVAAGIARTGPEGGYEIGVASFGYDAYRETAVRLSAGRRIVGSFAAGIAIEASDVVVAGVGRGQALAVRAGIRANPVPAVTMAAHVVPVAPWTRGALLQRRNRAAACGVSCVIAPGLRLTGRFTREERRGWSTGIGMVFSPGGRFIFRCGKITGPAGYAGGCEVRARRVRVAWGMRTHDGLAPTQTIVAALAY